MLSSLARGRWANGPVRVETGAQTEPSSLPLQRRTVHNYQQVGSTRRRPSRTRRDRATMSPRSWVRRSAFTLHIRAATVGVTAGRDRTARFPMPSVWGRRDVDSRGPHHPPVRPSSRSDERPMRSGRDGSTGCSRAAGPESVRATPDVRSGVRQPRPLLQSDRSLDRPVRARPTVPDRRSSV